MAENDMTARLEALEIRLAYQDRTIEELNGAVTTQWKEIDALKRLVKSLLEEVENLEEGLRQGGPKEPPPPHY